MKRIGRAWVFLPNLTRQEFNIYDDGNAAYSCIKWLGSWYSVIYRPEYGECDVLGKIEERKEDK